MVYIIKPIGVAFTDGERLPTTTIHSDVERERERETNNNGLAEKGNRVARSDTTVVFTTFGNFQF